jgi:hypothetical protein
LPIGNISKKLCVLIFENSYVVEKNTIFIVCFAVFVGIVGITKAKSPDGASFFLLLRNGERG